MRRLILPGAAVLAAASLPGAALAHGTLPGTAGFTAGMAHPFQASEQALALIALGLLLGGGERRLPVALVLAGFAAGLAAVPLALPEAAVRGLALCLATALGLAVALGPALPPVAAAAAALATGAAVGAGTDFALLPLATGLPALGGAAVASLLLVLNAMAFARCRLGRGPGRRIGGSWIAAAAVMLLAFFLGAPQALA